MTETTKVKGYGHLGWAVWVSDGAVGKAFWRNWHLIWDLKGEREKESAPQRAGRAQGATGSGLVGGAEGGRNWRWEQWGCSCRWEVRAVTRAQDGQQKPITVGLIGQAQEFTFHVECNALWHVKGLEGPSNRATCLTGLRSMFPKCSWPSCSANKWYLQNSCVSWKVVLAMLICEFKIVTALRGSLGHQLMQWRWDLKKWNVSVCHLWT